MGKGEDKNKAPRKEISWTCPKCGKTIHAYPEDMDTAQYVHELSHD